MKASSVYVVGDEFGNVINVSKNNPEFGYIVVAQEKSIFSGSWFKVQKTTALINAKVKDLELHNFGIGEVIPGSIYIHESLEPFDGDDTKNLKIAGDTGVICTFKGQPIYRKVSFTSEANKADILIVHDNKAEIVAALNKSNVKVEPQENPVDAFNI